MTNQISFLHEGLALEVTDSGDGDVFDRFFEGYDRAFVLPDEKEQIEGFRTCLALNHGAENDRLVELYGPFRELCVAAHSDGIFVGGANFIAMPIAADVATANLNYIYIDPAARRQGWFGRLVRAIDALIATLYPGASNAQRLTFIEQNDPVRMSPEDYQRDSALTGLDQLDRLRIWAQRGAKIVDFPYVQPPLSVGQRADENLLYSVLGAQGDWLSPAILEGHLRRFFGISVLKGMPIESEPAAAVQLDELQRRAANKFAIPLVDPMPALGVDAARSWSPANASFRDVARAASKGRNGSS